MKHNERSLLQKAKQIPRIALVRKASPATGEFAVFLQALAFSKEAQYAEWLKDKETTPSTVIIDGKSLVPTRYVYLAHTWLYINYITFWNANSSNYRSL